MKFKPSKRIRNFASLEAPLFVRAKELLEEGKKILDLRLGDPPVVGFHPPEFVKKALIDIAKENWFMYPGHSPWPQKLREAIAAREKRIHGVSYSPSDVIWTMGVTHAHDLLYFSMFDPEDELILIEPTYHTFTTFHKLYPFQKISSGSIEDEGWTPNLEELRENINEKTKGIVIVNPNNPTGAVYDRKTLSEIVDISGEYDIPIISDEIYDLTVFDGLTTTSMASISKDVPCIVLNGMTKNYCVPGWRVGYMCFQDPESRMEELKKRINNYIGYLISLMPTPMQAAAATAIESSLEHYAEYMEYIREMMKSLEERRDYTWKRLNEIDGISCEKSHASYFSFPRIKAIGETWKDDNDFVMSVLEEEGVFLRPGFIFGEKYGVGHTRVTFLYSINELKERYDRLEIFMKRHRS